ncbi:hypothetical protein [Pseudomonas typographi]|uniref:Secreted protein n=1 Tax=Pseudomonas typographi TaxID=2715964 RepID=A0ABR7Z492_9PSED|nr:hypothetical protein [Pseudomonas typographi]MBD1588231.1 hypothetical protein [Pseudomonas typographi]MBD1600202.1 hypothetical protein [Pseudomonas typographi]
MNATLLTLNVLAFIAMVSFHMASDRSDAALVHIDTEQWVQRPPAQHATMAPQRVQARQVREAGGAPESMETTQPAPVERYTF